MKRLVTLSLCFLSVNGALIRSAQATSCTDLAERSAAVARDVSSVDESRGNRRESHDDDARVEYSERTGSEGRRRSAN